MVTLTWLGTAGMIVDHDGHRLLLDPFLSRNARARPILPLRHEALIDAGIDTILVSHGHFDHFYDVPLLARRSGATVVLPEHIRRLANARGIPAERLVGVHGGETIDIDGLAVTVVASEHVRFDAPLILSTLIQPSIWLRFGHLIKLILDYPIGGCNGYLIDLGETRLLDFGSLGPLDRTYPACDLLLVPVQGRSDIQARAAEFVAAIAPKCVIPHHFDNFYPPISRMVDLEPFVSGVRALAPGTEIRIPSIAEPLVYP